MRHGNIHTYMHISTALTLLILPQGPTTASRVFVPYTLLDQLLLHLKARVEDVNYQGTAKARLQTTRTSPRRSTTVTVELLTSLILDKELQKKLDDYLGIAEAASAKLRVQMQM